MDDLARYLDLEKELKEIANQLARNLNAIFEEALREGVIVRSESGYQSSHRLTVITDADREKH